MSGVNDQQEQETHGGGGSPLREWRGGSIAPIGKSHQGGREWVERGWWGSHDYFPGVEI